MLLNNKHQQRWTKITKMAAELAVGAVVAEELVSTTAQGAVATYAIAKPTNGLKATFKQIANARDDDTR